MPFNRSFEFRRLLTIGSICILELSWMNFALAQSIPNQFHSDGGSRFDKEQILQQLNSIMKINQGRVTVDEVKDITRLKFNKVQFRNNAVWESDSEYLHVSVADVPNYALEYSIEFNIKQNSHEQITNSQFCIKSTEMRDIAVGDGWTLTYSNVMLPELAKQNYRKPGARLTIHFDGLRNTSHGCFTGMSMLSNPNLEESDS